MRMIKVSETSLPLRHSRAGLCTLCIVLAACFLANLRAAPAEISFEMLTAARSGDLDTVKKLLAQGEDVNAANADGVTALMVAASENRQAVVRALLDAGADARMKTASGKTAAFFASGKGNTEVAAILEAAASKPPMVPKVSLLVTADYDCTWKLDGESHGRLASGDSVKVQVELGKHLIEAVTTDGADQYRQVVELTKIRQELVTIGLKSVHDSRLKAEEQARLAQAARAAEAQRVEVRRQEEAQSAEEIRAAKATGFWTDSLTGLMWTSQSTPNLTWKHAKTYCQDLRLDNRKDWRLPTMAEFHDIYTFARGRSNVRGGIQLQGLPCVWGVTDRSLFCFSEGDEHEVDRGAGGTREEALCVRRSMELDPFVTDSDTGITWTTQDNGRPVNWEEAMSYCTNLRLGGYNDWRLPEFDELRKGVKGGVRDKWFWSSTPNKGGGHLLVFGTGGPWAFNPEDAATPPFARCVRRSAR